MIERAVIAPPQQLEMVARAYREELIREASTIADPSWVAVMTAVHEALTSERLVMLAGNGGSASTAGHVASDWRSALQRSEGSARVVSLCDNVPRVLAIGNDIGFDQIFAEQVVELSSAGDLLVLISVSGRSPNLVEAAQAAAEHGVRVVSLLGDAGDLAERSEAAWITQRADYGICEDLHLSFGHCMVRALLGGAPQALCASESPVGGVS